MNWIKWSKRVLNIVSIFYLVILFFPSFLFAKKLNYKCFSVHYHSELDTIKLKSVLDQSIELLNQSEFFDKEIEQNIFMCSGFSEFTFFTPFSRKAFAVNYPFAQNIFIAKSSLSKDLAFRNGEKNNQRSLNSVIAHETTHSLLRNKLGLLKSIKIPAWKNEGYCDFIANESSFNEQLGLKYFCNDTENDAPSFKYFKYRLVTKYLLEVERFSIQDFLDTKFDLEKAYKKAQKRYCVF